MLGLSTSIYANTTNIRLGLKSELQISSLHSLAMAGRAQSQSQNETRGGVVPKNTQVMAKNLLDVMGKHLPAPASSANQAYDRRNIGGKCQAIVSTVLSTKGVDKSCKVVFNTYN